MPSSQPLITALFSFISVFILFSVSNQETVREHFSGLNYPIKWKTNREYKRKSRCGKIESGNVPCNNQSALDTYQCSGKLSRPPPLCKDDKCPVPLYTDDPCPTPYYQNSQTTEEQMYNQYTVDAPTEYPSLDSVLNPCPRPVEPCLPVQDMRDIQESRTENGPNNAVIYDRMIYTTSKSKLRGHGDPIRGDIPVVPVLSDSNPDSHIWFRPAACPSQDLCQGAMNVMGDSENSRNLQKLMNADLSGTLQTFGGTPVYNPKSVQSFV